MAKKTVMKTTEETVYEVSFNDWTSIVATAMAEDELLDKAIHERPEMALVIGNITSTSWDYLMKYNGDTNEEDSDGTAEGENCNGKGENN